MYKDATVRVYLKVRERCQTPRLWTSTHTSSSHWWRIVGNVWEIWSAPDWIPYLP